MQGFSATDTRYRNHRGSGIGVYIPGHHAHVVDAGDVLSLSTMPHRRPLPNIGASTSIEHLLMNSCADNNDSGAGITSAIPDTEAIYCDVSKLKNPKMLEMTFSHITVSFATFTTLSMPLSAPKTF